MIATRSIPERTKELAWVLAALYGANQLGLKTTAKAPVKIPLGRVGQSLNLSGRTRLRLFNVVFDSAPFGFENLLSERSSFLSHCEKPLRVSSSSFQCRQHLSNRVY